MSCSKKEDFERRFTRVMTLGQGYLEKGDATSAIVSYGEAVKMAGENIDARLNLANAYLLAGQSDQVIDQCKQVLSRDASNGAAYYLMGCAYMRLNNPQQALQAFQESQKIDPAVTALDFQLGLAHERLGQIDEAIHQFETVIQFEPEHPSAYYQLSRLYQRVGRTEDAAQALAKHQEIQTKSPTTSTGPATFEKSKYTQPRVLFVLEQPAAKGVPVRFTDASAEAFGGNAATWTGPVGVIDYNHDGRNSLLVAEKGAFRLLNNTKGRFTPLGEPLPATSGQRYQRCLVGDLNNDRFEDVLMLSEQGIQAFRFATNGQCWDVTMAAGLKGVTARDGLLADLDFTGRLDLLAILPDGLRVYRNLGNFYFQDNTAKSGLPANMPGIQQAEVEDWRNEDVPGVFLARPGKSPLYYAKQRAGAFVETNLVADLPAASALALGDMNNDLLVDLVLASDKELTILYSGVKERQQISLRGLQPKALLLVDYDNDGWLDLVAYGNGIRVFRNLGKSGFEDTTAVLGLDKLTAVDFLAAADFDQDGDTDLVLAAGSGLQLWRNDGGNANKQLKLQLVGNRSNASALGARVEIVAGHWRTIRTLHELPFEIGIGKHDKIDLLKTRWFDLATTLVDIPAQAEPLSVVELTLPTGSCPYLYAWDGTGFQFVTDILGASPLGLPVSESRYVDADPEEFLALGDEDRFPARAGAFEVRITEELREVLYLDNATLVVVDHPNGTIVQPTSKMMPAKPFIPHELWTLVPRASVQKAIRSDGVDVTAALARSDKQMVGPVRIREPQLRGLAEPFSITMDFGELPVEKPLVLVLDGWLRFGGGMANIAGSLDPSLPFPFPALEMELPDGSWKPVRMTVGVPAGKTKTILVDLSQKLEPGVRRLKLSMAYEMYWDSISVCEKADASRNQTARLKPDHTDVHWRGFSEFADLPACYPLTPIYGKTCSTPPWRRTPAGWCTRYGSVDELLAATDGIMALLNGGDELSLSFPADRLPAKPPGFTRDFFLYVVGWDKDADYHVGQGWRVEPLPSVGMNDQDYGKGPEAPCPVPAWASKYNTRWVGPMVLNRETGTKRSPAR